MRVVIVYRSESDYAREVFDYLRDFTRRTGKLIEEKDPDTRDGQSFCQAYGIMEYPTVVALSDESQMLNMWRGTPLPQIDEVSYYAE